MIMENKEALIMAVCLLFIATGIFIIYFIIYYSSINSLQIPNKVEITVVAIVLLFCGSYTGMSIIASGVRKKKILK